MAEPAKRDERGLTLVEVLVALAIVFIVFLGLTDSGLVALEYNIQNGLREEGVQVADDVIAASRNLPFLTLSGMLGTDPTQTVTRQVRNLSWPYQYTRTITALNADNIQVSVNVHWQRKGRTFTHQAVAIVRR